MRQKLDDLLLIVSWREIAHTYFGKSASWLYHKLDGIDSRGGFTPEETDKLRASLRDLAARINAAADII